MHVSKNDHEICNLTGKKNVFHHENIVCQNQGLLSRGYVTFELKIIKFLLKHKQSYNISMSRDYFGKSVEALRHYFEKSLWIDLPLTYRFVYTVIYWNPDPPPCPRCGYVGDFYMFDGVVHPWGWSVHHRGRGARWGFDLVLVSSR